MPEEEELEEQGLNNNNRLFLKVGTLSAKKSNSIHLDKKTLFFSSSIVNLSIFIALHTLGFSSCLFTY